MMMVSGQVFSPLEAVHPWRGHNTSAEDISQDGCALYIFHQERYELAKFLTALIMTDGRRPMDIVDGGMSILIVLYGHRGHGKYG